jgi:hypothetical protein
LALLIYILVGLEAFSVPAKTTDNVAHLLIEEIIPRHSGIQILTSDNGGENCS